MSTTSLQLALAAGSLGTGVATGEPTAYAVAGLVLAATAARAVVRRRLGVLAPAGSSPLGVPQHALLLDPSGQPAVPLPERVAWRAA